MSQITGLGGVFIKASDPKGLAAWYQDHLGIPFNGNSYVEFSFTDNAGEMTPGYNILSFSQADSNYFEPSEKQAMLNLRVDDLFGLLAELRKKGIQPVGEPVDEQYGKFGWILDPEGNKIELWEPVEDKFR